MWFFQKKSDESEKEVKKKNEAGGGWLSRLKSGLGASSGRLTQGIADIFTKSRLDDETLEQLEDLLITADMGVATAAKLVGSLRASRFGKDVTADEIRAVLADEIAGLLAPAARPLSLGDERPAVILVAGVNGAGKTTTIGKLAAQFSREGRKVMLAAGDTFRAAAVEQLGVWAERSGASFIRKEHGADAAALAFEALDRAIRDDVDVLFIDTAGRLQNKANLMEELAKISRVLARKSPGAPHAGLLVLDATVGQNAVSQVEMFSQTIPITGLIVTKLDGTARGGVVVSLVERFGLPVHAIGVGEGIDDLRPFAATDYAAALLGVDAAAQAPKEEKE